MRIILDTDYEQNFVELWNPEKNYWERYIQCEKKETKPLNEEDKKIEKLETYDITGNIFLEDYCFKYIPIDKEKLTANEQVFANKINEIIDYINGGTNGE